MKIYKDRYEARTNNWSFYCILKKYNLLDKAYPRKRIKKNSITDEQFKKIATKYKSRSEFFKKDKNIYTIARRRKILNYICSHMKIINGVAKKVKNLTTGKIFRSLAEAARSIGKPNAAVSQAIIRGNNCGGFKFVLL